MNISFSELVVLLGIPSAVTSAIFGLVVWRLKETLTKKAEDRERAREKREQAQTEISIAMVASINAAIGLGEATARAVQKIPEAHCNGDMHAALEYAQQVKNAQKDLLTRTGFESIYG